MTYAKTLFENFGDKVKYWITLNEQNIFTSLGWLTAQHPPGKFDDQKTFYQVNHYAFMAHARAVLAYREMGGKGEIGASFAYVPSYALDCKPVNAMAKRDYDELKNFWWMDIYAYGRYPKAAMAYLKKKDYRTYMKIRYGILGQTMNLPGRSGRRVSSLAYTVARRLIGFN